MTACSTSTSASMPRAATSGRPPRAATRSGRDRTARPGRKQADDWGIKHDANCVCVPAVDFDNDGDLDLLLINFYSNVVLYRNNTDDKNWLRVKAVGTKSNPDGIGAKISVFAQGQARRLSADPFGRGLLPQFAAGGALRSGQDSERVSRRGGVLGQQDARGERECEGGAADRDPGDRSSLARFLVWSGRRDDCFLSPAWLPVTPPRLAHIISEHRYAHQPDG